MEMDRSSVPSAHSGARHHVWKPDRRRGATRKPAKTDGVAIVPSASGRDRIEPMPVVNTIPSRPLGRTPALWIIVGALWVSLGMIVSATLVTVAFLT